jgi:DNA-binding CsgD family transcriptional regulator
VVRPEDANEAADALLAAAMLGEGWEDALQRLADATDARGVSLTRVRDGRAVATLTSTDWAEAEAAIVAGRTPPSRRLFYPENVHGPGFVGDTDVWSDEELRRDPYFQEFLRPQGAFYHAKLRLYAQPGERLTLSVKRDSRFGPYEPADIAALNCLVTKLRLAAQVARGVLDAEAAGMVRLLHQRGGPVFEFDAFGRVLRVHGGDGEEHGVVVRQRRLLACDRLAQAALDRAVAAAVGAAPQPALVTVANPLGERRFVHVVPVVGRAREVFLATAAVVVVTAPDRAETGPLPGVIRQALGLTAREAQIAALLAAGLNLPTIAERLRLGIGTVRNHLKSIFNKTDTMRQGELIALLLMLQL